MADDPHETSQQADDALLEQLRAVASQLDPVPSDALLTARSQLAYLRLDADLAELVFDSALASDEATSVRSSMGAARRLSFEAGATQIEVEVVPEADRRRLVGQCLPAIEVELAVRHRSVASLRRGEQGDDEATPDAPETIEVTTDDLGRFDVEIPTGMVSLRCVWAHAGIAVETAWVRV